MVRDKSTMPRGRRPSPHEPSPGHDDGREPDGISVVTPTLGNPARVRALLESTQVAGEKAAIPWEHIVVDSTPGAQGRAIAETCRAHGARYVRGPDRVGAKRNAGARRARHPVVLFVDSDCVADPQLFIEHLHGYADQPDVGGVGGPHDLLGEVDTFALWVLDRAKRYDFRNNLPRRYRELGWNLTANLSVRAAVFREIGGFDERTLTVVGGEDVDLGIRIRKAGYRIVANPGALVRHDPDVASGLRRAARRVFVYGQASSWLCGRHSEFAVRHANPVLVAAAAGLAGSLLRRLPAAVRVGAGPAALAALVLREAVTRHEPGSGRRGALRDVLSALVDIGFDAGQVYGALRSRQLWTAARTFEFIQPGWFTRYPDATGGCGRAGCLCVSCD
ncbi:glycosyltransferase family 2 protein [Micromonospora sp. CPCC 206061]|uniref:glycosyltransferase family 2 protein n=1 Tax=Micromonospora sp. CPCC 206061 TaxID=3122410 RepID=UPI002FF3D717